MTFCSSCFVLKSTAEPRHPLHRETGVKCPLNIWSSRCVSAGLFLTWAMTLFSPVSLREGDHSADVLQSEPSASPLRCCISSPACEVYIWKKSHNYVNIFVHICTQKYISSEQLVLGIEKQNFSLPKQLLLHGVLKSEICVESHDEVCFFLWEVLVLLAKVQTTSLFTSVRRLLIYAAHLALSLLSGQSGASELRTIERI